MGLDMYLHAEQYSSGYEWSKPDEKATVAAIVAATGIQPFVDPRTPSVTVTFTVGYWRKANAIHNWFVSQLAAGVDECQRIEVSRDNVQTLKDLCLAVLSGELAPAALPPVAGFFFGSTEIDDGYRDDLARTVEVCDRALALPPGIGLFYRASW